MKNLKLVSTILLSAMLIFTVSTAVFADDDDIWNDVNIIEENNTVENNTVENNNTMNETNNLLDDDEDNDINVSNEYNNLYNTKKATTTSESENLAKTGIGDSSIISLIIIISLLIAVYSGKKVNDYKNL